MQLDFLQREVVNEFSETAHHCSIVIAVVFVFIFINQVEILHYHSWPAHVARMSRSSYRN
jgi:hypothetical protein